MPFLLLAGGSLAGAGWAGLSRRGQAGGAWRRNRAVDFPAEHDPCPGEDQTVTSVPV